MAIKYNSDKTFIGEWIRNRYEVQDDHLELLIELRRNVIINNPQRVQNLDKNFLPAVIQQKTFFNLIERFNQVYELGKGVTLKRMILYHGEELGTQKFTEYKNRQQKKNTLEHKKTKLGWQDEDFRNFNKSRAITLENLVKKHGEELGQKKYLEYCEKQSYQKTLEYNIEKYGEKEGTERYFAACKKKGINIENLTRLYGAEKAEELLIEYHQKISQPFYQKQSQVAFWVIEKEISSLAEKQIFFEKSGKEFCSYSKKERRCFMYDYVSVQQKVVIEYHGDDWHANPKRYRPDDRLNIRKMLQEITAAEIWAADNIKRTHIEQLGYRYFIIWESDWIKDRNSVIERLKNELGIHN